MSWSLAMSWSVVAERVGIVGQPTIVRLMPGLRPARTRVLRVFSFLVGGRRLRRITRRFGRSLKLDHQLNQLVLAQALQISAIHEDMDSEIGLPGKADAEISSIAPIGAPKMAVVIAICLDDMTVSRKHAIANNIARGRKSAGVEAQFAWRLGLPTAPCASTLPSGVSIVSFE